MPATYRPFLFAAALACLVPATAAAEKIFPFPVSEKVLDNGLKVVVVPYDSPGTIAFLLIVRSGSRNEVEPGHSGFAHFFEHMMFRGTDRYSTDDYNDVLKRMGADSNAFTSDDQTVYYIIGPAAELETIADVESDRFKNLKYSEEDFRREALAVLGEYNKSISSPFLPMFERMRALAFKKHTYGHTTIGFLDDIKAMPGYYEYSLGFFNRHYRPENCILLVVGDVEPAKVNGLAEAYFGDWRPGFETQTIEPEPPQTEALADHIDWPAPISPHLMVGYRAPAFSDATADTAALDLAGQLLFSESAPLYQKLVVEEQWVDSISGRYSDHRDPYLFTIFGRIKSAEALPKVIAAIDEHLAKLKDEPVSAERLERIKSHLRYRFALGLDSPGSVAFTLDNFLKLTGDPDTVNRVHEHYLRVTPEDVQRMAREVFKESNRTRVTLAHEPPAAADATAEGR